MNLQKIWNNRRVLGKRITARIVNHAVTYRYRRLNAIWGRLRHSAIRAFWWAGERNFGDQITPLLLEHVGCIPVLTTPQHSQFIGAGSILEYVNDDYKGVILGTGLLTGNTRRRFQNARILAIRGQLTRDRIQAPPNTVLGDTGLLISDIFTARAKKKYALGLVPHYEDLCDPRMWAVRRRYGHRVKIINVLRHPSSVVRDIDQCECILSSSLHGLVVADALGIPNRWCILSNRLTGVDFKFRDYYSAFDVEAHPLHLSGRESLSELVGAAVPPPYGVEEVQSNLRRQFMRFAEDIRSERAHA
ncbi:hypothetical protein D4R30_00600 [archaeon]|nr:MAG: hypothetical protein D4R30_00600 [archaeon]